MYLENMKQFILYTLGSEYNVNSTSADLKIDDIKM